MILYASDLIPDQPNVKTSSSTLSPSRDICYNFMQGQKNEFVVSPRKATGAPVTDVTAASAFAAQGSTYSFAGERQARMPPP